MSINETIDSLGIPENEFAGIDEVSTEVSEAAEGFSLNLQSIKDFIFTQTGQDGDYLSHPLNFAKSEGLGQMIKGFTGFLQKYANVDSLRLAILDVIFGYLKFSKELKTKV